MIPASRTRKCKVCREAFRPFSISSKVCGPDCAEVFAKAERVKVERRALRIERQDIAKRRIAIKTRSQWMKEAQAAFNGYIRARDAGKTCICCDKPLQAAQVGGGYDCGHFRSVGSAPHLRFDERNAHGQTKQCNRWGAGRAIDYRIGLVARIGIEAVESIEADQSTPKWTIDDLIAIKAKYKAKLKAHNEQFFIETIAP